MYVQYYHFKRIAVIQRSSVTSKVIWLILCVMLFAHIHCVYAQDDLFDLSLEDLANFQVNTASLRNQSRAQAPSKVTLITQDIIQKRNYRYLADLLKDLPGVRLSLYSSSVDSGSSQLIVRGITGNNKLVLMWNGQRLNHPDAQPLHITPYLYPLENIEKVEVVYGSTSAIYGSDTISMSINLISADTFEEHAFSTNIASGRYKEQRATVAYQGSYKGLTSEFIFDWFNTDGVDFSSFDEFYSQYPLASGVDAPLLDFPKQQRAPYYNPGEHAFTARARFAIDDWAFQTYYQSFKTQTQTGWSPIIYESNNSSGQYHFVQKGFYLTHKHTFSNDVTLESSLEHTRNKLNPDSHWNRPNAFPFLQYSAALEPRGVGTKTYKLNYGKRLKLEERLFFSAFDNQLHTVAGISYTHVDMLPKSGNLDFPGIYSQATSQVDPVNFHDLSEHNLGLFIQTQYDYSSAFSITAGGRFDDQSRYGNTFNPRFVINYENKPQKWFVKGIYSTSYLAPAAFFTFDTFIVPRTSQQVPNLNLKPEETTSYEINMGKTFKYFALEGSIYHTKVENLIRQRQVKSIQNLTDELGNYTFITTHTINAGNTEITGLTLEAKTVINNQIMPYISYTLVNGSTQDTGNAGQQYDLIHAPQHQIKLGFDSQWLDDKLTIYAQAHYFGKAPLHPDNYRRPAIDNNGQQFEMADYWLIELGARYKFNRHVSVYFDVSNTMDKHYEQPIVGQETSDWTRIAVTPGVPRQYFLGVEVHF